MASKTWSEWQSACYYEDGYTKLHIKIPSPLPGYTDEYTGEFVVNTTGKLTDDDWKAELGEMRIGIDVNSEVSYYPLQLYSSQLKTLTLYPKTIPAHDEMTVKTPNYNGVEKVPTEEEKKNAPLSLWIQSGSEAGQGMFLEIDRMNTSIIGINDLDVSTVDGANHAINAVHGALEKVSSNRSKIGAQQNRLEHTIANEQNVVENTTSAESRIRDTDMAKEMVEFSKGMILENVGQAMLAQANKSNQDVLALLS